MSSSGITYVVTHKVKSKDFLSWIGIRPKYKIYFKEVGLRWTFDQTKDFFYRRIRNMKEEQAKENWLKAIDRASNIRDLIEGKDE